MFIIATPWEGDSPGTDTLMDVSHSRTPMECITPEFFESEWNASKEKVSDTIEEWEFDDIVKEMEDLGWKFQILTTTNVEY